MTEQPAPDSAAPDPAESTPASANPADSAPVAPSPADAPQADSTPAAPEAPPTPAAVENPLGRTRISLTWKALIVFAVVLVLLLIFVLQNTQHVEIRYFGFEGKMPLAVAMLLSAVAGVLLAATAGTMRIFQLRRRVRKSQAS